MHLHFVARLHIFICDHRLVRIHVHLFQRAFTCFCMHAHNLRAFGFPHNSLNVYVILHSLAVAVTRIGAPVPACFRMFFVLKCLYMHITVRTRAQCMPVASMLFALTGCGMPSHVHMLLCVFPGTLVPACVLVCFMFTSEHTLATIAFNCPHAYVSFDCISMSVHALLTLMRTHSFEHYFHLCIFVCACVPMCTHAHM